MVVIFRLRYSSVLMIKIDPSSKKSIQES
jgi:hypothetical protein